MPPTRSTLGRDCRRFSYAAEATGSVSKMQHRIVDLIAVLIFWHCNKLGVMYAYLSILSLCYTRP
jgi:hypothetical protein